MLYITLSVMIISVFTLTIAYAVLSTTLNITGSAEISGSSWGITISKYDIIGNSDIPEEQIRAEAEFLGWKLYYNGYAIGDAELIKEPTISGTTISDIKTSLTKPGDAIVFYYTVTNNGTIPAKVDSIVKNSPVFSSSTNNASDIELVSNNWFSDVDLYSNVDDFGTLDGGLDVGYILCPGETIYFEYGAVIEETATAVPSSNITVSNLGGSINFVQAAKNACSNS